MTIYKPANTSNLTPFISALILLACVSSACLSVAQDTAASAHATRWTRHVVTATEYVVNPAEAGRCQVYTDRTASGTRARRGTIAVDPRRFSFGTRFRVSGYGYGVARDTGNYIHGSHIDLAVTSCREAFAWGVRRVPVLTAAL
jgi:3D (Asp-Asp-Asp) domain-containing protein